MKALKTGVLLVNLGTPDSPATGDVRTYLREFLMDERVIDIPILSRFMLVNGIIAPFRAPKSAATYQKIWTKEGSPLRVYTERMVAGLRTALGPEFQVELAMRYQHPSIREVLGKFKGIHLRKLLILPLFPQYASATSGSVLQRVMEEISHWQMIPEIQFISSYYDLPEMVAVFAKHGQKYLNQGNWDHVLFSYHGLPKRQLHKADAHGVCLKTACCDQLNNHNYHCYRAQCFSTTRAIADALQLDERYYSTCFQSRLGKTEWLKPYASDRLKELAQKGMKRILVFSPAFVADCLETIYEIGQEYDHEFREMGGEKVQMVESLNDDPEWIAGLSRMIREKCGYGK